MAFAFDPEFLEAAMAALNGAPPPPQPERGDWKTLRQNTNAMLAAMAANAALPAGVSIKTFSATAKDGAAIALRWYTPNRVLPGSAVLYIHGGGMICGAMDHYDQPLAEYAAASGVPFLSVDYRLAPEFPHPVPIEDCFAGLEWLLSHANALGIDSRRIAVMGDSAGGGLAAALAIMARDRDIPIAKQILIYPMLDDRTTHPDPKLAPFATWTYDHNYTGWRALLGESAGGTTVSPYAAPARARDLSRLAPIYLDVGELDIFRAENAEYAMRAAAAGVSAELHVHPGAPHGFDRAAPNARVTLRAMADRHRVLVAL